MTIVAETKFYNNKVGKYLLIWNWRFPQEITDSEKELRMGHRTTEESPIKRNTGC